MSMGAYEEALADPHALRCKFCGEPGLYWAQRETADRTLWVLKDADTHQDHRCDEYKEAVSMKEGDIRKKLKARVEAYGGEIRAVAWLGRKHAPDVLALFQAGHDWFTGSEKDGTHVFVETKKPGKDATEAQAREHQRMRDAGCTVLVITTEEELNAWLPPRP
jgi:hypothetical protein